MDNPQREEQARLDEFRVRAISFETIIEENVLEIKKQKAEIKKLGKKIEKLLIKLDELKFYYDNNSNVFSSLLSEKQAYLRTIEQKIKKNTKALNKLI